MSESTWLELYTTQELINELMRRATFLGVLIHSEEEYRGNHWGNERMFKVHYNQNLERPEALRLLDTVVTRLSGCE